MRRLSMATRDELVRAVSERYRSSGRAEKTAILNEFTALTGFHRKHAVRLLRGGGDPPGSCPWSFSNRRCQWRSVDGVTLGTRRSPGRHHRRAHGSLRGRSAPHHGLGWLEQVNVVSAVCCRCPARHPGERPCSGLRPGGDEPGGGFAPELVLMRGQRWPVTSGSPIRHATCGAGRRPACGPRRPSPS